MPTKRKAHREIALLYATAPTKREAITIAKTLLRKRLVACVNITEGTSVYWWQGRMKHGKEFYLLLKSVPGHYKNIEGEIRRLSSYSCPCVFSVRPSIVSTQYELWLETHLNDA